MIVSALSPKGAWSTSLPHRKLNELDVAHDLYDQGGIPEIRSTKYPMGAMPTFE